MNHTQVLTRRNLVLLAAASLTIGTAATPAPAQAVSGVIVTQSTPTNLGMPSYSDFNGTDMVIAAGGAADVYPSTLDLEDDIGSVSDINVLLDVVTTTNLESVHVLLVAPDGRSALLLGHAGGANASNSFVALDDEESGVIPDDGPVPSPSVVKPSVYASPAAPPSPAPALTGDTALSTFDGSVAGGEWDLYVYDDDGEAVTVGGWSLDLRLVPTPYPSELSVPAVNGVVTDVDVSLHMTTTFADDADLLLVGPQGQHTMLMSDVGGGGNLSNTAITINDEASSAFPDEDNIAAGSYRPTDIDGEDSQNDDFRAPAPLATGVPSLGVFDGTNPAGTWQLYGHDPFSGDLVRVDAWTLDIEYAEQVAPSGTVSIAGGAAGTRTRTVTLNLSATDPQPGSGISDVRFSNDGTTFSAFRGYAAALPWTLARRDGTKRVYAQYRDADGNLSPVVSDTIVLDTVGPKARKVRPKQGARDVSPTANIRVWANEALAPATVTKANVVLKTDGHKVTVKVTYLAGRKLVKVNPKGSLGPGLYVMTIRTAVTDTVGNRLDTKPKPGSQPLTWTFVV